MAHIFPYSLGTKGLVHHILLSVSFQLSCTENFLKFFLIWFMLNNGFTESFFHRTFYPSSFSVADLKSIDVYWSYLKTNDALFWSVDYNALDVYLELIFVCRWANSSAIESKNEKEREFAWLSLTGLFNIRAHRCRRRIGRGEWESWGWESQFLRKSSKFMIN